MLIDDYKVINMLSQAVYLTELAQMRTIPEQNPYLRWKIPLEIKSSALCLKDNNQCILKRLES